MHKPAVIAFSKELEEAQQCLEHSLEEVLDALRWRACLRHGFPRHRPRAEIDDVPWTLDGEHYAATPTAAVDAVLRKELAEDATPATEYSL